MLAIFRFGWRLNTPWTTSDATVSWIARPSLSTRPRGSLLPKPERRAPAPRGSEPGFVPAVAEMERDRDPGLCQAGPHGIVQLVAQRAAPAVGRRHGRRTDVHHPSAALHQRVDFGGRGLGIGQRDHRDGEEAALIVETPVVLQPPVERRQARHRRRDVVLQCLLDPTAERGEQQCRTEALLIHHLDPLVTAAVLRMPRQRLDLEQRAGVDALGNLTAEQRIEGSRDDDRVERGVRDEGVELAAHQHVHPLALLHRADAPVLELRVEVSGECVERLVVVIVRVDRSEVHAGFSVLKKNASALPWSQASRTSGARSSFRASSRQRWNDSTG